jgi:hypothetical protein
MWMWMREGERDPPKFAPICYLLGVNGIRGQNICPTTFAPHVWHLRGKLGVNLPHLPYLPHHPNRPNMMAKYLFKDMTRFYPFTLDNPFK